MGQLKRVRTPTDAPKSFATGGERLTSRVDIETPLEASNRKKQESRTKGRLVAKPQARNVFTPSTSRIGGGGFTASTAAPTRPQGNTAFTAQRESGQPDWGRVALGTVLEGADPETGRLPAGG